MLIHQSVISALMLHISASFVQMRSALSEVLGLLALALLALSEDPSQFRGYFHELTSMLLFSLLASLLLIHHEVIFIFNINIFVRIPKRY